MATIEFYSSDSDSDSISVTSTVLSEQVSEYEVESILDEHTFDNQVRYLVKWVGYPTERCSWEPSDSFSSNATLKEWRKKKRAIAEGQHPAFDTDAWEENLASLQAAKQDRQNRRQAKRRKLGILAADADTQLSTCLSEQTTESMAPPERGAAAEQPKQTTSLQSTTKPKAAESISTSNAPKPLSARRQTLPRSEPPNHGPDGMRPSRPSGPSQPPILFGNSQGGAQPGPHRAKKSLDPDPFRRFNLSTQRRFEKAKHDEPHPDASRLELFRPSDFPRQSGVNLVELRIRGNARRSNTLGDGPPTNSTVDTSIRDAAGVEESSPSPVVTTRRLQHAGRSSLAPHNAAPIGPGMDPCRDIVPNLPQRRPGPTSRKVHSLPGVFWNPGEILVHIYYGPDKQEIGPARLCGLSRSTSGSLLRSKSDSRIKLWFQHPLTSLDCQKLCLDVKEDVHCTGWIEGFDDTEPWIYRIGQYLRDKNIVAFLFTESSSCDELIAYSPASQDFTYLGRNSRGPIDSFLRLAVTRPEVLTKQIRECLAASDNSTTGKDISLPTKRLNDVTRRESCHALAQGQPSKTTSPVIPSHKSSPTVVKAPQPKFLGIFEQSYGSSSTPVVPPPQTVAKPMDAKLDNANESPMSGNIDNEPSSTAVSHKIALNDVFFNQFGVSFSMLTAVDVTEKSTRRPCFYIMYPRDAQETEEYTSLVHLLEKKNASIYSNKLDPDWKRFLDIKNGILLIHESFMDRYSEPWFRELTLRPSWRFSLSPKPAGTCFHRLFPTGGVVLITEDFMVHCPEATVIMLQYLQEFFSGRFPGSWKVMFRPDVLNWLRTIGSAREKRPGLWLVMYHLILKLHNSNDGDLPDGSSDAYTESAVISPPSIPFYGSKSEEEHPFTPKDITQEHRKADHLIEFFAGWALVNSHRFRRFYVFTNMPHIPRWMSWHHLHAILWGEKAVLNHFEIDHTQYWNKLYKSACREEAKSQCATPFTPHTPKVPSAPTSVGSVDKGLSTAGRDYPQPYK